MKHVLHGLAGTLLLATASLGSMSVSAPAFAAESYDNCTGFIDSLPATITKQGVWCLKKDLSTSMLGGAAIDVAENNVTIDCNYFKVGGLGAGDGTATIGISVAQRNNATIRNCNIRGFLQGIRTMAGGGHVIENNTLDGNTYVGISVNLSHGSIIRGNRVLGTGGSSAVPGTALGIAASGADVIDNAVTDVSPASDGTNNATKAYGIFTNFNSEHSIIGNRIRGVVASQNGTAYGIYNENSGQVIIRSNDVQGTVGVANTVGVYCSTNKGTARDNVIAGFATANVNCFSAYNVTNN